MCLKTEDQNSVFEEEIKEVGMLPLEDELTLNVCA